MALSVEEKRRRERERKARQRAANREKERLAALPRIGPAGRTDGGTGSGTPGSAVPSNEVAALALIGSLTIPDSAQPRVALLITLARDLDSDAIAQRSAIAQRYEEAMDRLVAACKPRERDELDELRRSFYLGSVDDIDDDPEARRNA